jgi:hypothetical protein
MSKECTPLALQTRLQALTSSIATAMRRVPFALRRPDLADIAWGQAYLDMLPVVRYHTLCPTLAPVPKQVSQKDTIRSESRCN